MTRPSLDQARLMFADRVVTAANVRSARLLAAFGRVPRERFLGPGPWLIRGSGDRSPNATPSDDPRHVLQDVSVAIDPDTDLYNGQPSRVVGWIEALDLDEGDRAIHIGCGTGYYTALMADVVGPAGTVTAIEINPSLASQAADNLATWPHVTVVRGAGASDLPANANAILVHAGATHVLDEWLDAVDDGGRLLVPLACTFPGAPKSLAKGPVATLRRHGASWSASLSSMVMIYALLGARDEAMNAKLGRALMAGTAHTVTHLRRGQHEPGTTCWLHGETSCLSSSD